MKKIMTLAVAAMIATTTFAQNPDALKQIKKAKSADEVKALITTNESSMSAAENAQAYNKMVDLYMKNVSDAQTTMQTIELEKQMGQEPKETVDMPAFYADLEQAYNYALTCDKYDIQPNDKGKVAPKFRKSNGDRLYTLRAHLINAGQEAQNAEDNKKAAELYTLYVTTGKADLFKEQAAAVPDPYISEVARVASLTSFQNGDVDTAMEMVEVVLEDPEKEKEGINLKMYYLAKNLETHEDSLQCLETFKELYAKYPEDTDVFTQVASMYGNLGQTDKQDELIAERIAAYPNDFMPYAMRGQTYMNDQKYDEAITDFKKALGCSDADDSQKALVNTFIGFCYNQKAAQLEVYEEQKAMLQEGMPYLEEARKLDPERDRGNWAYPLYNCYYHLKGESDPATIELKELLGL